MKKIQNILLLVLALVVLGSCSMSRMSVSSVPVKAQLNIAYSDLEFVNEVEGSSVQSYAMGLPLGGEKFKQISMMSNIYSTNINLRSRGVNNALVDALSKAKDIDFIIPISMNVYSDRMFLGRQDSVIVTIKTFKLKEF